MDIKEAWLKIAKHDKKFRRHLAGALRSLSAEKKASPPVAKSQGKCGGCEGKVKIAPVDGKVPEGWAGY